LRKFLFPANSAVRTLVGYEITPRPVGALLADLCSIDMLPATARLSAGAFFSVGVVAGAFASLVVHGLTVD